MTTNKKSSTKESIFTPKKTVTFFIVSVIGYSLAAMVIWPLLEFIFSKITNSEYSWTVIDGIVEPCIFGLVFTIIDFLAWDFFHKNNAKKTK